MASSFSVWLRETARLYLRYVAVGLIGIPIALLYALARRADWNMSVVGAMLFLLGFVCAFLLWRWLGTWQMLSTEIAVESTDATRDPWVDLVNAALRTTVTNQQVALCFQQSVHANEETFRAWNLLLTSAANRTRFSYSIEVTEAAQAALKNLQAIETEQENYRQAAKTEPTRQRQPAWSLALNGQPPNAYGLA